MRFVPGEICQALFFSDGFDLAEEDLRSEGADFRAIGEKLRAMENADPGCCRYPRFKPHDDASALLCRIE